MSTSSKRHAKSYERYAKHSGLCVPVIDGKMGDVTEESCVCEPLYKQARAALRGGE